MIKFYFQKNNPEYEYFHCIDEFLDFSKKKNFLYIMSKKNKNQRIVYYLILYFLKLVYFNVLLGRILHLQYLSCFQSGCNCSHLLSSNHQDVLCL